MEVKFSLGEKVEYQGDIFTTARVMNIGSDIFYGVEEEDMIINQAVLKRAASFNWRKRIENGREI